MIDHNAISIPDFTTLNILTTDGDAPTTSRGIKRLMFDVICGDLSDAEVRAYLENMTSGGAIETVIHDLRCAGWPIQETVDPFKVVKCARKVLSALLYWEVIDDDLDGFVSAARRALKI